MEHSTYLRNLADMDVFSKSDPMCVLQTMPYGHTQWKEVRIVYCLNSNNITYFIY